MIKAMSLVFLVLVLLVGGSFGSSPCVSNCTFAWNANSSACHFYQDNLDWLPTAYADSALCACTGSPGLYDDGWHSPSNACVRGYLLHAHTNLVNQTMKDTMRALKAKYCTPLACDPDYLAWIEDNWIPIVYKVHVDSFRTCCCPEGPAPYVAWMALMFNYHGFLGCDSIVLAIELAGACGCQGW
eukprot:TRINITY_DN16501_c0_g1_i1.p1 TRINITY_DN16501_c0_g1~~TRINITY_DN16501_c0_g1_i1.p1  ORF type:complete len:185 (-),score=16.62 TRINITY_DN16501_c0_g1_i1:59-613(-)